MIIWQYISVEQMQYVYTCCKKLFFVELVGQFTLFVYIYVYLHYLILCNKSDQILNYKLKLYRLQSCLFFLYWVFLRILIINIDIRLSVRHYSLDVFNIQGENILWFSSPEHFIAHLCFEFLSLSEPPIALENQS